MDIDIKELMKAATQGLNLKDFKGDVVGVKVVENEFGTIEPGGIGIQNVYSAKETKAATRKKEKKEKSSNKSKTLKYYVHGNNGVLMKQRQRVNIVYRLLNKWGWIDKETKAIDFDAFFEGEPRHCNISWKANSTILTILLQDLIKQPYIKSQTGLSAKSLVEQQFGKTANSDRKRLDSDAEERIQMLLYFLDIRNPLFSAEKEEKEELDIEEAAVREIVSSNLRKTKGI